MGKPDPPDPPDMTAVADASMEAAQLSYDLAQQQLAWAKEQYAMDKETVDAVVDQLLEDQEFASDTAQADRERYETVFQPLEDQFIEYAQQYASPDRIAAEAGRAQAGVTQQFDQARQAAQTELESFGINPADTRYAALDASVRTDQAAATAAAGTEAARTTELTGQALLGSAIELGKGYPGQSTAALGAATAAGGTAGSTTSNATNTASGSMNAPVGYINAGSSALGVGADAVNNAYANEVNAYNAQLNASSGWGSALGSIIGSTVPMFFGEEGGAVPDDVSPSGGAIPDDVSARLTAGEFIIPEDIVRWKGEEYWHKELDKIRGKREETLYGAIPA
jgi:hypothetical protein